MVIVSAALAFGVIGSGLVIRSQNTVNPNVAASTNFPADVNNDNRVDVSDLSFVLDRWGSTDTLADVYRDGIVNISDLSYLLSRWGTVSSIDPGAHLPITYSLTALQGTLRYVAPNGSDTTGNGSISNPYATLAKAVSVAVSNDSIVVRGGTYREGNVSVPSSKKLHIAAYPGETPLFNGAQVFSSGWVTEGSYQYHAYTPRPATNGSGISFTTGQNLTGDGIGKYPDQAWLNNTQLRQVSTKAAVAAGKFWVDTTNSRIYLMASDVAAGSIEASAKNMFITVGSPNTVIEGLKITRYSNTASDEGVVVINNTADGTILRNTEISESAFAAMKFVGDTNILKDCALQNVTVTTSNWMGVSALTTDNLTLDSVKITNMNMFDEFTYSPQSGALKTSRTRYTKVVNSEISNNHSHGLWFDQSNVDIDVANNQIVDNLGTAVFFEISDDLLLINNYIRTTSGDRAFKGAGSSGMKLVNNTIIGGYDPVGIYTDNRSIAGCSNPANAVCAGGYDSDRDKVRSLPATLDWMPRVDLMINNIVAYPKGTGYCNLSTSFCVLLTNNTAEVTLQSIIHHADASRGIPQTFIDGNVYANGTGMIFATKHYPVSKVTTLTNYSTIPSLTAAMAASPVLISGIDANSKAGNSWVATDGTPTAALAAAHNQAIPIPVDANINEYISSGTKHYGVTYK